MGGTTLHLTSWSLYSAVVDMFHQLYLSKTSWTFVPKKKVDFPLLSSNNKKIWLAESEVIRISFPAQDPSEWLKHKSAQPTLSLHRSPEHSMMSILLHKKKTQNSTLKEKNIINFSVEKMDDFLIFKKPAILTPTKKVLKTPLETMDPPTRNREPRLHRFWSPRPRRKGRRSPVANPPPRDGSPWFFRRGRADPGIWVKVICLYWIHIYIYGCVYI